MYKWLKKHLCNLEVDADTGSSVSIFILAIRTLPLSLKSVQNLHRLHCFLISGKSYILLVFL